jgi:hypothetical protein
MHNPGQYRVVQTWNVLLTFVRLVLLRPIERFLTQWIAVSTAPGTFAKESIRLGDNTNFLRAGGFFFSAISTAFLAEVATLNLLGIGGMIEPYYWLFVLLTSIPFVIAAFFVLKFVAPIPFKDALHLSFYPIGAGIFTGAAFALVASSVVALLLAANFIPDIRYDFTQWGEEEQVVQGLVMALRECLKSESFVFTLVATGLQEAYSNLRPPIDAIAYVRPIIGLTYLVIAAGVFATILEGRKPFVFGGVIVAALIATGFNVAVLKGYLIWNPGNAGCEQKVATGQIGVERLRDSLMQKMAADLNSSMQPNGPLGRTCQADGRTLLCAYRFKTAIRPEIFNGLIKEQQKYLLEGYCSGDGRLFKALKVITSHTYYSFEGERLTSFSIGPTDCQSWQQLGKLQPLSRP